MRLGMVVDTVRCIGCDTCAVACKTENNLPDDVWWNRVWTVGGGLNPTRPPRPATPPRAAGTAVTPRAGAHGGQTSARRTGSFSSTTRSASDAVRAWRRAPTTASECAMRTRSATRIRSPREDSTYRPNSPPRSPSARSAVTGSQRTDSRPVWRVCPARGTRETFQLHPEAGTNPSVHFIK